MFAKSAVPFTAFFFFILLTNASSASNKRVFEIQCRELLDLASYDVKFSKRIALELGESIDFRWDVHSTEQRMAQTNLSVSLVAAHDEMNTAYLNLAWKNFSYGKEIESRAQVSHFFAGEQKTIDLLATRDSNIFRNSCIIRHAT